MSSLIVAANVGATSVLSLISVSQTAIYNSFDGQSPYTIALRDKGEAAIKELTSPYPIMPESGARFQTASVTNDFDKVPTAVGIESVGGISLSTT